MLIAEKSWRVVSELEVVLISDSGRGVAEVVVRNTMRRAKTMLKKMNCMVEVEGSCTIGRGMSRKNSNRKVTLVEIKSSL